ncbi:DUF4328 domain-containing protein [Embleya sp. AB8]|uniref:DUF4328 domain-containing protein n=1 Tax=Embleya sp. AB8 TaxID=3156304 RepID=UPI003C78E7F4
MLCSSCGARSALPDRCTNCGDREYAPPVEVVPAFRSLRGWAAAVHALLGVAAVASLYAAIASFHQAALIADTLRHRRAAADPTAANHAIGVWWGATGLTVPAVGVVFVIWFHRARRNVDTFPPSVQRLSGAWAIGAWCCPGLNLFVPPLIAHDIWRASDPRTDTRGGHPLVWAWWWTYLAANAILVLALTRRATAGGDESYRAADTAAGWAFLLLIAAAGLAGTVVARITGLQTERNRASSLLPRARGPMESKPPARAGRTIPRQPPRRRPQRPPAPG